MSEPSEDEKKQMYDGLSPERKNRQSYTEWVTEAYSNQYTKWMPWIEDKYLEWFGKDNKASYVTKDTLDKTKVTGIDQVDQLQGDMNSLVGNQVGKDGLFKDVGDMVSKEVINRAERGGKDDHGSYYGGPAPHVTDRVVQDTKHAGESLVGSAQSAGPAVSGGLSKGGGYVERILGDAEK